jgi:hypothetical protein
LSVSNLCSRPLGQRARSRLSSGIFHSRARHPHITIGRWRILCVRRQGLQAFRQVSQRLRDVVWTLLLLPRHLLALLARLGERDGDRLLAAFHLAAPPLPLFAVPRL